MNDTEFNSYFVNEVLFPEKGDYMYHLDNNEILEKIVNYYGYLIDDIIPKDVYVEIQHKVIQIMSVLSDTTLAVQYIETYAENISYDYLLSLRSLDKNDGINYEKSNDVVRENLNILNVIDAVKKINKLLLSVIAYFDTGVDFSDIYYYGFSQCENEDEKKYLYQVLKKSFTKEKKYYTKQTLLDDKLDMKKILVGDVFYTAVTSIVQDECRDLLNKNRYEDAYSLINILYEDMGLNIFKFIQNNGISEFTQYTNVEEYIEIYLETKRTN